MWSFCEVAVVTGSTVTVVLLGYIIWHDLHSMFHQNLCQMHATYGLWPKEETFELLVIRICQED